MCHLGGTKNRPMGAFLGIFSVKPPGADFRVGAFTGIAGSFPEARLVFGEAAEDLCVGSRKSGSRVRLSSPASGISAGCPSGGLDVDGLTFQ